MCYSCLGKQFSNNYKNWNYIYYSTQILLLKICLIETKAPRHEDICKCLYAYLCVIIVQSDQKYPLEIK